MTTKNKSSKQEATHSETFESKEGFSEELQEFNESNGVEMAEDEMAKNPQENDSEMDELTQLKETLNQVEQQLSQHKESYLLAKAEADNIRKRAEKDVSNARKYALEKFIPELLSVKDALELGVKAATEKEDSENTQLTQFVEGSEMAIGMFMDTLKKVGVEMLDPKDELFNPEFHQAMTMVPNQELPANTIMEVVQKGYVLNERLIRPAMVVVSKKS